MARIGLDGDFRRDIVQVAIQYNIYIIHRELKRLGDCLVGLEKGVESL